MRHAGQMIKISEQQKQRPAGTRFVLVNYIDKTYRLKLVAKIPPDYCHLAWEDARQPGKSRVPA